MKQTKCIIGLRFFNVQPSGNPKLNLSMHIVGIFNTVQMHLIRKTVVMVYYLNFKIHIQFV